MASRFDLLTLKLFVAIVEEQSIARAAERENIVASAISKRISDLERLLHLPLLMRHQKGIEPTAAGQALLHHARIILRDVRQLEHELVEYSKGTRGHMRIFATDSTIFNFLPQELSDFLVQHPMVRVELEAAVSPAVVQAVAEGIADIGVFAGDLPTGDLTILPYHKDQLVAVVPLEHSLTKRRTVRLHDLLDYELIDQERRSSIEMLLLSAASKLGRPLKMRIRVESFDAMCRMVAAGLGIGIVPKQFADRLGSALGIHSLRLDEVWAIRQHRICVRHLDALPPLTRLLVDHLVRSAEAKRGAIAIRDA